MRLLVRMDTVEAIGLDRYDWNTTRIARLKRRNFIKTTSNSLIA